MKKRWIIAAILIVVGIIVYIFFNNSYTQIKGFKLTFENSTGDRVEGIYLTCAGISKDIDVPALEPNTKTVVKVQPKNYGENSLELYYKDKQGSVNKQTIVGYFEESYGNGYVEVKVENVEADGKLKMSSKYRFANTLGLSEWQ
jgi:hypothetical protein